MNRILYLFAVLSFIMGLSSCDKKDCNGDLDGMWQLIEWKTADGVVKEDRESMIFYSFQLQMARFDRKSFPLFSLMSSLEVNPSSIRIYNPFRYQGEGHDIAYPMSSLAGVGVPESGYMKIEHLTTQSMVLSTESGETLRFRKY